MSTDRESDASLVGNQLASLVKDLERVVAEDAGRNTVGVQPALLGERVNSVDGSRRSSDKDYPVNNSENIQLQTFRFKMSEDLCLQLYEFSKLHQYDDRKSFKDAWYVWINTVDIESLINIEIKTMKNQGYTGDVIEKLFKSARYYYRKKKSQDFTEPVQRKPYVGISSETLEMIDKHLKEQFEGDLKRTTVTKLLSESKDYTIIENISPAQSFALFCKTHVDVLAKEIQLLKMKQDDSDELLDAGEVIEKFKKTYKNRYYNFKVNIRARNSGQGIQVNEFRSMN